MSQSFRFVATLLSEVTQEDSESQRDASQKHCPCHRGDEGKVHCLRWCKRSRIHHSTFVYTFLSPERD